MPHAEVIAESVGPARDALEYADSRARLDNARTNSLRTRYDLVFKSKILDFYQGKAITLR